MCQRCFRAIDSVLPQGYRGRVSERLNWIDGLRGIAVGMVLLYHSFPPFDVMNTQQNVGLGSAGVSLFFVLSGLCLSYRPLQLRASGQANWLDLRRFARARCWRILPPYYTALALFLVVRWVCTTHGWLWEESGPVPGPINLPDVLAHVLLLQNIDPRWTFTLDGPMWSLATEAQWYVAFPALLLLSLRWPRMTVILCLACTVAWSFVPVGFTPWQASVYVPARLLEFAAGILVAYMLTGARRVHPTVLVAAGLPALALLTFVPVQVSLLHVYFVLAAVLFGSATLLVGQSSRLQSMMGVYPLARLGTISYSLYLVHIPIVLEVRAHLAALPIGVAVTASVAAGLASGIVFYLVIERPILRRFRTASSSRSSARVADAVIQASAPAASA